MAQNMGELRYGIDTGGIPVYHIAVKHTMGRWYMRKGNLADYLYMRRNHNDGEANCHELLGKRALVFVYPKVTYYDMVLTRTKAISIATYLVDDRLVQEAVKQGGW